ncbi:MAG: hypothetical protein NTX46_00310 [Chloroflexi bacterium]|nr:hypothetical protein [Chloroflexota bacterium]
MKKWKCIQVHHHKNIGELIEEYQNDGWNLHTYQVTGDWLAWTAKHFLLFQKDVKDAKEVSSRGYPCPYCQVIVTLSAKSCPNCGKDLYYPTDT